MSGRFFKCVYGRGVLRFDISFFIAFFVRIFDVGRREGVKEYEKLKCPTGINCECPLAVVMLVQLGAFREYD